MQHFLTYVRASYRYIKALKCRYEKRYSDGLHRLADIDPHLPDFLTVRMRLLRGDLYTAKKQYELAYREYLIAFKEAPNIRKVYSDTDKFYIQSYAAGIGVLLEKKFECDLRVFRTFYDQIDLENVSRHLIAYFPLPDHPDWKD